MDVPMYQGCGQPILAGACQDLPRVMQELCNIRRFVLAAILNYFVRCCKKSTNSTTQIPVTRTTTIMGERKGPLYGRSPNPNIATCFKEALIVCLRLSGVTAPINHTMPYYSMLCYAMLCYAMLCYTILYYTILYYTIFYYTILYYTIP